MRLREIRFARRPKADLAPSLFEEDSEMKRAGKALLVSAVVSVGFAAWDGGTRAQTPQKLTFEGDTALWTMSIKSEKAADFERIMTRMREALMKSEDPLRRQQAAGWKVMKMSSPLPDGNLAYVHIVHPVVANADYTIMQTLYDAFPDERQALYELYRGAFDKNLSLATGTIAVDLSKQP